MIKRLTHNDEVLLIDEEAEISWANYLAEFEEKVWPLFQHRGYSKDTALTVWRLEQLHGQIKDLCEDLRR